MTMEVLLLDINNQNEFVLKMLMTLKLEKSPCADQAVACKMTARVAVSKALLKSKYSFHKIPVVSQPVQFFKKTSMILI